MNELKKKITWYQPLTPDRQDSVWYDGLIATVDYEKIRYEIYADGEKRVYIGEDYGKNGGIVEFLEDNKIFTDKDLNDRCEDIYWENNNWFSIFPVLKLENGKEYYPTTYDDVLDTLYPNDNFDYLDEQYKEDLETYQDEFGSR